MYNISELSKLLAILVPIVFSEMILFVIIAVIVLLILKSKEKRRSKQNQNHYHYSNHKDDATCEHSNSSQNSQINLIQTQKPMPASAEYIHSSRKSYKVTKGRIYNRRPDDQAAIEVLYKNKVPLKLCNSINNGFFFEPSEAEFYYQAKAWADKNGYILLSKVREADIIRIDDLDKYPLNRIIFKSISQKHFDFVFFKQYNISTPQYNCIPMLIVEIDGLSHESKERRRRDKLVDLLIEKYNQQIHVWRKLDIIHLRRCYAGQSCLWQEVVQACENTTVGDSVLPVDEILNKFLRTNERS